MIRIDDRLAPADLLPRLARMWDLSAHKIRAIEDSADSRSGTPVFTVRGRYVAQGWTEWTQGFQFGSALLQFDATDDRAFLDIGRTNTLRHMAPHVTHGGVHDHGFNNVSTYGNLRRLMLEGRIPRDPWELAFYELALRASGSVQAVRWTRTHDGAGFVHSFNGPHSLFSDTMRSLRSLALAWRLGHRLLGENDEPIPLLGRLVQHAHTTVRHNVSYGEGRDTWDLPGRVVHESLFNPTDGRYRCPSSQQGWSPFTTWTRGSAWVLLGCAEILEFLDTVDEAALEPCGGRDAVVAPLERAARVVSDFTIDQSPTDGIPYWDTGAPGLREMDSPLDRPADPFNAHEPVDSSAAAISAQGLIRFGHRLAACGERDSGTRYEQAGLTILRTLLDEPYLATDPRHEGLLLHTIYHRPRGWDHVPDGSRIPRGESCQWGDYHLREAALLVQRLARGEPDLYFFGPRESLESPEPPR